MDGSRKAGMGATGGAGAIGKRREEKEKYMLPMTARMIDRFDIKGRTASSFFFTDGPSGHKTWL